MAIFVIGMHNSGICQVASALQSLGVNSALNNYAAPNISGACQDHPDKQPATLINDIFLEKNGLDWRSLPLINTLEPIAGLDNYTCSIAEICKHLDQVRPWYLSDPRLSFLLPYWKPATKAPSAIICVRRPDPTILSLTKAGNISAGHAAALWELYTRAALRNTSRMTRAIVVYEEFLTKPEIAIKKLLAGLPELARLNPSPAAIKAAVECVQSDPEDGKPPNATIAQAAAVDLYRRATAGDLSVAKDDHPGREQAIHIVRLETEREQEKLLVAQTKGHLDQANAQLASQEASLSRHMERLRDIVSLIIEPDQPASTNSGALLDQLYNSVRSLLSAGNKSHSDETVSEMLRAKGERLEWLQTELRAAGARSQTLLDKIIVLELEVARRRAEHEQHELAKATSQQEIRQLTENVERLSDLLSRSDEDRTRLEAEYIRVGSELETVVARLSAERVAFEEIVQDLRSRIAEGEALIAQHQSSSIEADQIISALQRSANEHEATLADLRYANKLLEERNSELTEQATMARDLANQVQTLQAEADQLRHELHCFSVRETGLVANIADRERTEAILREAAAGQARAASELQIQLAFERDTTQSLNTRLALQTELIAEYEARHLAERRLLAESEVRTKQLEASAAESGRLQSRVKDLQAKVKQLETERERTQAHLRDERAKRERQIEELQAKTKTLEAGHERALTQLRDQRAEQEKQIRELTSTARRAIRERDQAMAGVAERDAAIRERDDALLAMHQLVLADQSASAAGDDNGGPQ